MQLKSSLGIAALEGFKEDTINVDGLNAANEGWKGAVGGFVSGMFGIGPVSTGAVVGAALKNTVAQKKKEIELLAKEIEKAALDNGKSAVSSGKLSSEDFTKHVKVGSEGIIKGYILGTLFGPIYTAIKGSELEDLLGQLKAKTEDLDKILAAEAKKQGKPATESNEDDVDPDAVDKEPKKDAADTTATGDDATAATSEVSTDQEGSATDGATDTTTPQEGDVPTDGTPDPTADPAATAEGDPTGDATTEIDPATGEPVTEPITDGVDPDATTAEGDPAAVDENGDPVVGTGNATDDENASAATAAVSEVEGAPDADLGDGETEQADSEVVEEEMGDVDAITDLAEDADEDVEKLTNATEALEGIVSVLDAAAQRGGLDVFAATLLRNNLNTVTTNLSMRPLMIPALEDMGEVSTKIDGANTTKDQIVAFIKRILEALKQAFNKFGEWVTEIYKRLTNAFIAIERRAQKLAEQVKASQMKTGPLETKSLAEKLSVNGELVTDLPGQLDKIANMATYLNDPKSYSLYLEAIDLCEQLVKDPSKSEEIRGRISEVLAKWATAMQKSADSYTRASADKSKAETFTLGLLNAQLLNVTIPSSAENIRILNSTTVKYGIAEGTPEALSQADAIAVCEKVAQLAKEIRESGEANRGGVKELIGEIQKRKDTIVAIAAAAAVSDNESEAARKVIVFVNTLFMTAPKLPVHAINKALPGNLNSALDYVAASIGGKEANAVATV